jgi:hypothetical protein
MRISNIGSVFVLFGLVAQAFLSSGCSSPDGTFLHVLYRMNIGVGPVMPCLGLYNDTTDELVPPVVCEKDVSRLASELRVEEKVQVLDATIRMGNVETVWPNVDASTHSIRPFIYFPEDDLLYTTANYTFNGYTSPEGEVGHTLDADFTYHVKVTGQKPEFQSFSGARVIR